MKVNVDLVKLDVKNTPPTKNVHLAVATNILSNQSFTALKNLAAALKPDGFILLEETGTQPRNLKAALKETNLVLAGTQINSSGNTYVLLKKRPEKKGEPIIVQITEKNFSWLESVKAALTKSHENHQEVLLVSQGEELIGKTTKITCQLA